MVELLENKPRGGAAAHVVHWYDDKDLMHTYHLTGATPNMSMGVVRKLCAEELQSAPDETHLLLGRHGSSEAVELSDRWAMKACVSSGQRTAEFSVVTFLGDN
ncbi:hypothetical protein H4R18_002993, partial [Coemansia javaensis]